MAAAENAGHLVKSHVELIAINNVMAPAKTPVAVIVLAIVRVIVQILVLRYLVHGPNIDI